MSLINFSDLQVSTSASNNDQLLLRLNNSLSGEEGFSRITFSSLQDSLEFSANGGTINGDVIINGSLSSNFIKAASANIDVINITNYELSGFSILSGGLTVQGTISSNNVVYSSGGNSNEWNTAYSTVQSFSGSWAGVSSLSSVAWVDKLGNDSTGEVGNIHKPYLTIQSAFDDGAKVFYIGAGTFDGITATGNINISIIGAGSNKTTINSISSTNSLVTSYSINVQDLGNQSVNIDTIQSYGYASGDPYNNGGNGGNITLTNVKTGIINNYGGNGGNGISVSIVNGTNGGNAGSITIQGICFASVINNYGGQGGEPYDNSGIGGNGGNGGGISGDILYMYNTQNIYSNGGNAGNTDSFTGNSSVGGSPGNITLRNLEVDGTLDVSTGDSYGLNPTYPPAGTLTLKKGYINNLDMSREGGSSPGTINGQHLSINSFSGSSDIYGNCIFINAIANGSPTINSVLSYVDGVPYGT